MVFSNIKQATIEGREMRLNFVIVGGGERGGVSFKIYSFQKKLGEFTNVRDWAIGET